MSRARNAKTNQSKRTSSKKSEPITNEKYLRRALDWFLTRISFHNCKFHGNTKWLPIHLCALGLLWVWSQSKSVTKAFGEAAGQSKTLFGTVSHKTYQGFVLALLEWTPSFMGEMQIALHKLICEVSDLRYRNGRWVAIAADGSRVTTPRTKSNENAFCAKNYGGSQSAKYRRKKKGQRRRKRKKTKSQPQAPQIWTTLMWHMGLGIPWCWKLGPSTSSERQHVLDLLKTAHFLENTLFVADAGFVGFDFWKAILDQGHHFVVRVGANVRLMQGLGYRIEKKNGIVYCWPHDAMRKKLPPLKLRLVKCYVGKKKVSLLTSVLEKEELSDDEVAKLYKERWGIELEFRCLKQTFERRKLRCHNSDRALVELEWSLLGMTILELFALKEQMAQPGTDPLNMSFAKSLDALRSALTNLGKRSKDIPCLADAFRVAVVDNYERKAAKAARYQSKKKTKPSCGDPKITAATKEQRKLFEKIRLQHAV
jgi:hypothetical protein